MREELHAGLPLRAPVPEILTASPLLLNAHSFWRPPHAHLHCIFLIHFFCFANTLPQDENFRWADETDDALLILDNEATAKNTRQAAGLCGVAAGEVRRRCDRA